MTESQSTPSSDEIQARILEALAQVANLQELMQPFNDAKQELNKEVQSHRDAIEQLNQKAFELDTQANDTRAAIRRIDFDLKRLERERQLALSAEALREQFTKLEADFDNVIAGAPWREFAYDHQIKGAKLMAAAKRGILADKPGLGKSLTSLIWLDLLKSERAVAIVPKDTADNYIREIRHWAPHRMVVDLTSKTKKERDVILSLYIGQDFPFIMVMNYEAWRRDKSLLESIASLKADSFIIDEAHNMKNNATNAAKGITAMVLAENRCPKCGGSIDYLQEAGHFVRGCVECKYEAEKAYEYCSVQNVLPMTGTPILNKPSDLFPILHLIDPVAFPSQYSFERNFCVLDRYTNKWIFAPGGLDRLTNRLKERYISRDRKQAGIIIPPQEIQYHNIEFDAEAYPEQAKVLNALNKYAQVLLEEDKGISIFYIIELILRKRQAMLWPASIKWVDSKTKEVKFKVGCKESIKLDRVVNSDGEGLLPELVEAGERVVVFSQFKTPFNEIIRRLNETNPEIRVARFDGDTNDKDAAEIKIDFDANYMNANGRTVKYDVVLANYKKGGVGLNMTGASQMIILDEEWNPGKRDQGYGRIDRIGQTKETTVHVLRVKNSIDTWMASVIAQKEEMIGGFNSATQMQQEMLDAIRNGDMI